MALDKLWFDIDFSEEAIQKHLASIKKKLDGLGEGAKLKIDVNRSELVKSVKEALLNGGTPYKINVVVDKASATKAIEAAIGKGANGGSYSVDEARYAKTMAVNNARMLLAQSRADMEAQKASDAHALAQERLAQASMRTQRAQQSLADAHSNAAQATDAHSNASIRLGKNLTGLVSISGDLRNQIGMLISAYTVERLLKNVVEIGGEFEKQKLAMGSMLGSLEQADDIFNRMKNLALTSPFNFKDLSNYSRQLAAYGTEYKDLYDTTNRLADISAGLGGDMSRLVLAFSQVKAAAYLRGQEMRQFTEFGVGLPEMLAKKYTEAEGKIVTAGDVIERVSKRMVSFNDVKDVLWQSTDKGGKFYGMQDVLSQSVSGMASNLKDAIDTMYYDIANSNSGVIKGTIKDVTSLVSQWRLVVTVLGAVTTAYSLHRLAVASSNRMLGVNNAETLRGVMAGKAEEASILRRKAAYGELSVAEKERLANTRVLTNEDLRRLVISRSINADALMRMVNTRKITAAQASQVASDMKLSAAETNYLVRMRAIDMAMTNSTGFTRMGLQVEKVSMMLNSMGRGALYNLWAGLRGLFSVQNIAFGAVSTLVGMYLNYKQKQDEINQDRIQFIKESEDGAKNLKQFLDAHPIELVLKSGNRDEIKKTEEQYKEELQNSPIDMSGILTNISAISDAKTRIEELRKAIEELRKAKENAANSGSLFADAINGQDGFFSESVQTNYQDLIKSRSNMASGMKDLTKTEIFKAIDYLKGIPSMSGLIRQLDEIRNSGLSTVDMMQRLGVVSQSTGGTLSSLLRTASSEGHNFDAFLSALDKSETSLGDASTFWGQIEQAFKDVAVSYRQNGIDLRNTTQQNIDRFILETEAIAQQKGFQGDILTRFRLIREKYFDMRNEMQNHVQAWKLLYDEVVVQLHKGGKNITDATEQDVEKAEKAAVAKLKSGEFGSLLDESIGYISSNLKPIAIRLQIMGGNVNANKLYNDMSNRWRKKYGPVANVPSYAMPTTEDLGQYRSDLKSNIENSKKDSKNYLDHYGKLSEQYKGEQERLSNYLKAQSLAGFAGDNAEEEKSKGTKSDTWLKDMQDRLDSVKKAIDIYKKWKDAGKSEAGAIGEMSASGIFPRNVFKNITSENGLNKWYKETLENLAKAVKNAKSSPERKKYADGIAELLGDFDRTAIKDKFDEYGKYVEALINETKNKWDNYQKLLSAGSSRAQAASFVFGGTNAYGSLSEAMAGNFYNEMAKNNVRHNIDFNMTEEDVKKLLGDGKIAEELFKLWKDAKEQIKKDRIDIQINADKAKEQISSIADKIKSSIEKALDQSLGINTSNGKQSKLSEFASIDNETGLLKLNDNAKNVLSSSQIEDAKNMIASENQEITKLSSQLLELMPAWDDIFGKSSYKSIRDITRGLKEIEEIVSNAKIINDKNGKASYFTSVYTDENGQEHQIKGNIGELDRLKNQKDTLFGDRGKKGIAGAFTNVFDSLNGYFKAKGKEKSAKENGDVKGEGEAKEDASEASRKFAASLYDCISEIQKWNNALSMFGSTIEALGGGTGVSDAAGVAGGMLSGASSMSGLGPWGMAAGAAMGAITSIASLHDKKLDRAIEKSKQKVKDLQLAYTEIENVLKYHLGDAAANTFVNTNEVEKVKALKQTVNDTEAMIASLRGKDVVSREDILTLQTYTRQLSGANKELTKYSATLKYLDENDTVNYGNAYNYQRNLYLQQIDQLKKQRDDENRKKKTDKSKIQEYDSEIADLESKVSQFSEDLADSLYGINIKDWAKQFGDALFDAWQKGNSGAEAFRNTANSIMANLTKSWFTTNIVEKAFEPLKNALFGNDGVSGIFGVDNRLSKDDMTKVIAESIDSAVGIVNDAEEYYNLVADALKKKGIDIKNTTGSSSSGTIGGVTEQEGNIIAAYMDAIRQDTYNNRMALQKITEFGVTISSPIMESQLLHLQQIASNTYRNAEMVSDIKRLFNDITLGNKKIYVA